MIFVAHSLGDLLIKEALRRSEVSEEPEFRDIVKSTKGVIFLGTPHRGSPGMADLGETVRSIASTILRVDSNAALLRTLGTDSPELELGRESFTTLWRKYGFRVKTFQEAWGISGINAGPLNKKVVPDTSSTLDDPREHAETISANHMNMCRFDTSLDAGYRKIAFEIGSMIASGRIGMSTPPGGPPSILRYLTINIVPHVSMDGKGMATCSTVNFTPVSNDGYSLSRISGFRRDGRQTRKHPKSSGSDVRVAVFHHTIR